jgi:putative GTP pyrophosphokinase
MDLTNWKSILLPYTQAVEELKIKFKGIRKEYLSRDEYSPIEFVTGRVKKISSILEKANKRNLPLDQVEEGIEDIAGIRIMCQFEEDINKIIDIIKGRDGKDLEIVEERDYITNTKESGYRSYHVIIHYPVQTAYGEKVILAEIQIRTLAMNFWATIEHSLRYKYKQNMPECIQERLNKAAEAAYLLDKEMAQIRDEVMKSQQGFQEESSIVGDILGSIQVLAKNLTKDEMNKIYDEFWGLWEDNQMTQMQHFQERLQEKVQAMYR